MPEDCPSGRGWAIVVTRWFGLVGRDSAVSGVGAFLRSKASMALIQKTTAQPPGGQQQNSNVHPPPLLAATAAHVPAMCIYAGRPFRGRRSRCQADPVLLAPRRARQGARRSRSGREVKNLFNVPCEPKDAPRHRHSCSRQADTVDGEGRWHVDHWGMRLLGDEKSAIWPKFMKSPPSGQSSCHGVRGAHSSQRFSLQDESESG